MPEESNLVSIGELAEWLGVGKTSIRRWMERGMPSYQVRRGLRMLRRFDPDEVAAWLDREAKGESHE